MLSFGTNKMIKLQENTDFKKKKIEQKYIYLRVVMDSYKILIMWLARHSSRFHFNYI